MSHELLDDNDVLDDPIAAPPVIVPAITPVPATNTTLELTSEQEQKMLDLWNATPNAPPDLKTITQTLFGKDCDGRSLEARAVKKALTRHSLKAKTTADPERDIELSEAHQTYIANNAKNMSTLDIAKIIFANPSLTALHAETRAVQAYRNSLMTTAVFTPNASAAVPTEPYRPPKTINEALERVNGYINFCFDKDKLTPQNKKNLSMLIGYMHTYRFIAQMNNYVSESDRKLAEDAFVRSTYDKPDLAQEEIDQYIEYANQVVNGFTVQRRSNQLQANLEDITTANDDTIKISMSLVEAIGKASTEYHQCLARQQKLLDDLKEKRSTRLSKQVKDNASILNLIQLWRSEESRQDLLVHAAKEQAAVSAEVDKLSSMADIKARILGLTKDEIRYG